MTVGAGAAAGDLHVWAAPAHWQAIDFLSDLHLAPDMPRTVAAWAQVLRHSRADALCLLGDVFEVWVGDDGRGQPFEQGLIEVLRDAAGRRPVAFMVGNRDFLVGPAFHAETGLIALPDPSCLLAWGRRWLLCHGDEQCLDDKPYQAFRAQVRSAAWQHGFLARPLTERVALARDMRRQSATHQALEQGMAADLDADACRLLLAQAGARTLIHGHTHRPGIHDLGDGLQRVVLSDWDLDDAECPRAEVLRLQRDGHLQRLSPEQACAA